jgi:flagellar basal-body rod protein FlgC
MSFWDSLHISESALSAQRLRLDLIANNIANVETTRTASGGPYQRKDVVFTQQGGNGFTPYFLNLSHRSNTGSAVSAGLPEDVKGVQVASIITDQTPGPKVYDPTHPDADKEGYVTYPNVNLAVEMTNMLSATRSYEANLSVITAARRMALKALEIGK